LFQQYIQIDNFYVVDHGCESALHSQAFGISQGCPLSPFLFVIMMSVLMWDAKQDLKEIHNNVVDLSSEFVCHEVLYADDTLIVDITGANLQKYMQCIEEHGRTYGLKLNFSKLECLPINCECLMRDPDGHPIQNKSSLKYLGAQIAADGSTDSELSQKIGLAEQDFKILQQVWKHSKLTRRSKSEFMLHASFRN